MIIIKIQKFKIVVYSMFSSHIRHKLNTISKKYDRKISNQKEIKQHVFVSLMVKEGKSRENFKTLCEE